MKIFCISFQRTGTTSLGRFFIDHGFKVATYRVNRKNSWTELWFRGDYESIFKSVDFQEHDVFEDDPWWCQEFYKFLFHRYPDAKFVLFERCAQTWFDSMVRHSNGKTLGNSYLHSRLYLRESDFEQLPEKIKVESTYSEKLDMLLPLSEDQRHHYVSVYKSRNAGILEYFSRFGPQRLFHCHLEDDEKWIKLGNFFGLSVNEMYVAHEHKAKEPQQIQG